MHQNTSQESFPPLLTIEDLSRLINRKTTTILVDRVRRPETLPPDCTPPSQKSPVWRLSIVLDWFSQYQKAAAAPRQSKTTQANEVKRGRGAPTKAQRIAKREAESQLNNSQPV